MMKKWEYYTEELNYSQFTDEHFDGLGKDGWELITIQIQNTKPKSFYAIYKRELIEINKRK